MPEARAPSPPPPFLVPPLERANHRTQKQRIIPNIFRTMCSSLVGSLCPDFIDPKVHFLCTIMSRLFLLLLFTVMLMVYNSKKYQQKKWIKILDPLIFFALLQMERAAWSEIEDTGDALQSYLAWPLSNNNRGYDVTLAIMCKTGEEEKMKKKETKQQNCSHHC